MLFKFGKIESPLGYFFNLKAKLYITCSTKAATQIISGTDAAIFYQTLLILHRLLHRVPFLV